MIKATNAVELNGTPVLLATRSVTLKASVEALVARIMDTVDDTGSRSWMDNEVGNTIKSGNDWVSEMKPLPDRELGSLR